VWKYLANPRTTIQDFRNYIGEIEEEALLSRCMPFVVLNPEREPIGLTQLKNIHLSDNGINEAEMGTWLSRKYQGMGINAIIRASCKTKGLS